MNNIPSFGAVSGQEIQPIPNSFIVKLKSSEEGTFDISSLADSLSDLEGAGVKITEQYDEIEYLKIQFDEEQPVVSLSVSNITITPQQQQIIEIFKRIRSRRGI